MSEKKVLIITYYWPPSGGSGVQRWLKFVKYLPKFGWTPYVFTPENPTAVTQDESFLTDIPAEAEVIKFPIWEPYRVFSILSGVFSKQKSPTETGFVSLGRQSLFQKISTWIRANVFIPDPRIFWVRPSVKFLKDFIVENGIKTIITTGPPHSVHLIGMKLKKKNPSLHWMADFRDPWSEWGFLESIRVSSLVMSIHRRMERSVLTHADEIITVTPSWKKMFERLSGRSVNLITNGFDEDDFEGFQAIKSERFLIRHVGIVNEKCDPRPFMRAVGNFCEENDEVRKLLTVEFVGSTHPSFREFIREDKILSSITVFTPTVSHRDLINIYASSTVLVLILTGYKDAEGYLPGKLFEYLATGLPVLGVGPAKGDAASLLQKVPDGIMIDSSDLEAIKSYLNRYFDSWKDHRAGGDRTDSLTYSRREITNELVKLL
jgi:glycosyltransferase involved in cell wall biosynthesis